MNHSKEPWTVDINSNDAWIKQADGQHITGYGNGEVSVADAERIVACVNACRGIPNEELEELINRCRDSM